MSKFVIVLLLGVALARAAPGGNATAETPSSTSANYSNPITNNENKTAYLEHETQNYINETHRVFVNVKLSAYEKFNRRFDRIRNLADEKIVLVFGNSGSGKTSLASFLTGGNITSELIAEDLDLYHLVDKDDRIGQNLMHAKTLMPNVFRDEEKNTVYFDIPGVEATGYPVAHFPSMPVYRETFFPHAKSVKLLVVITHSSVSLGESRHGFLDTLSKIAALTNGTNHFDGSIAMVVNKVRNSYKRKGHELELVSDEIVLRQVAYHLEEEKNFLEKMNGMTFMSEEDKALNQHKINIIDILLKQENGSYVKIGIFRVPDRAGNLKDIENLAIEKEHIQHIVNDKLEYASLE